MLREVEVHHNCTVQILQDDVTGELDIGWWNNETPPDVIMEINFGEENDYGSNND